MTRKLAVVVPAYNRADLLQALLAALPADRVSRVYVSIDGPAAGAEAEVAATFRVARDFTAAAPFEVYVHQLPTNVGVAVNVLGCVAWMLRHEERGAILEDDCHPIPEFFSFIDAALDAYAADDHVWLACGTQVAPSALMSGNHVLSKYPLIWGWGTTRTKWGQASEVLGESLHTSRWQWMTRSMLASPTERFWHAGHRRASEGFVDTWDLPLVYAMRRAGARAVLPATALVSNVGDDARATHTAHDGRWTRLTPEPVHLPLRASSAEGETAVDAWLEQQLYGISARHLVSTSVRWAMDRLTGRRKRPTLVERLPQLEAMWRNAPGPVET